jgi:hypothetical protein
MPLLPLSQLLLLVVVVVAVVVLAVQALQLLVLATRRPLLSLPLPRSRRLDRPAGLGSLQPRTTARHTRPL